MSEIVRLFDWRRRPVITEDEYVDRSVEQIMYALYQGRAPSAQNRVSLMTQLIRAGTPFQQQTACLLMEGTCCLSVAVNIAEAEDMDAAALFVRNLPQKEGAEFLIERIRKRPPLSRFKYLDETYSSHIKLSERDAEQFIATARDNHLWYFGEFHLPEIRS